MGTSWALGTTQPNCEAKTGGLLSRHGVAHQIFYTMTRRVVRGRVCDLRVPAFPRYMFLESPHNFRLLEFAGITSFLRSSVGDVADATRVIEGLRARAVDGILPSPPIDSGFRFGAPVLVIGDSSMAGRTGIFQYMIKRDRACIAVDIFGRMVNVDVDMREIEPHEPRRRRRRDRDDGRRRLTSRRDRRRWEHKRLRSLSRDPRTPERATAR